MSTQTEKEELVVTQAAHDAVVKQLEAANKELDEIRSKEAGAKAQKSAPVKVHPASELVFPAPAEEGDIATNATVSGSRTFAFGRRFRLSSESGYNGDTITGWIDSFKGQLIQSLDKDQNEHLTLSELPDFDQSLAVEVIVVVH
jgi:hypothetical protein